MVNKVILIGNVGADPEVRYLEGGVAVANLRLATTERYKNKNGENVDQTEWHNIVLWRGLAEIVEKYVRKGMRIYIEGRLRTRSWEDQNGSKRYTTEIWTDNMQMLSYKQESEVGNGYTREKQPQAYTSTTPNTPIETASLDDSDDLPF